jgi:hypothetical protein
MNQQTNLHELLYELYANGVHAKTIPLNFLSS